MAGPGLPIGDDELQALGVDKSVPGNRATGAQPAPAPGVGVGSGRPPQGPVGAAYERFLGTDVDYDPLEIPRLVNIIGFSIAGGALGAKTPQPLIGAIGGGIAGAALGAAAPEAALEVAEMIGLTPPGTRDQIGLSWEELQTVMYGEALLEMATSGGVTAARLVGRGLSNWVTKPGTIGRQTAEAAAAHNIPLLPVQVGQRTLPRSFVSVFGRFPWLASALKKRAVETETQYKRALMELPERIAPVLGMNDLAAEMMLDYKRLVGDFTERHQSEINSVFQRADEMGVKTTPYETVLQAEDFVREMERLTPMGLDGKPIALSKTFSEFNAFLQKNILPLGGEEAGDVMGQSLGQMNELLGRTHEAMRQAIVDGNVTMAEKLEKLTTSIQVDMLQNTPGEGAKDVISELLSLDKEFSFFIDDVYTNAVAKKLGTRVTMTGAPGVYMRGPATHLPHEQLANVVSRGLSVQSLEDIQRMTTKYTFQKMTAKVISDHIDGAFRVLDDGGRKFDLEKFANSIGVNNKKSEKYQTLSRMLEMSGGLSMKELEELVKVGQAISSTEIPNVSTFIARRAGIGGIQGVARAILPGAAVAGSAGGATAAVTSASLPTILMGVVGFVGGSKLFARMISNPNTARALRKVQDKEAKLTVRRAAAVKAVRGALWATKSDKDPLFEQDEYAEVDNYMRALFKQLFKLQNEEMK